MAEIDVVFAAVEAFEAVASVVETDALADGFGEIDGLASGGGAFVSAVRDDAGGLWVEEIVRDPVAGSADVGGDVVGILQESAKGGRGGEGG